MKRFFLIVSSLILALALCFIGTGCGETLLTFNNNFYGGGSTSEAPANLTEVLTYDIAYTDNYHQGYIVKSTKITDEVAKFNYYGTSVHTLTISDHLPSSIQTDINTSESKIYRLQMQTTINVEMAINGAEQPTKYVDTIETDVYFLPAELSFSPLYSKVSQTNTFLSLEADMSNPAVTRASYQITTTYNSQTYTQNKTIVSNLDKPTESTQTSKTYEYDYRRAVDNTQFMFALRNMTITDQSSYLMPVISFSYGYPVDISITNEEELTINNLNVDYAGNTVTSIPVQTLRYIVNTTTNAGSSQFVSVQKQATDNLPYRALPVQIVETLTS